jgi:hypothetical protein
MKFVLNIDLNDKNRCNGCLCVVWATPKPCWCSASGSTLSKDNDGWLIRLENCPLVKKESEKWL